MAGSLIDKGDGTWGCRVYVGRGHDGKRVYHYETYHGTKRQAEKHLAKVVHRADDGHYDHKLRPEEPADTLREYLELWLDHKRGTIRARTLQDYRYSVKNRINPELGDLSLDDVTPDALVRFYSDLHDHGGENGKPLSARTVRKTHAVLRNALETAAARELIPSNPCRNKIVRDSLPTQNASPDAPANGRTVDEYIILPRDRYGEFVELAEDNDRGAYFVLILGTGLRPGEALALRWSDYDGQRVTVNRTLVDRGDLHHFEKPKTKQSRRTVTLPSWAAGALDRHREDQARRREAAGETWADNDLIFPDESGRPLRQHRTWDAWHDLRDGLDLPDMRIYDLRHSCLSNLMAAGHSPVAVSKQAGHSTVTLTLNTYGHAVPGSAEDVANTLDGFVNGDT